MDLMKLDTAIGKGGNQELDLRWKFYSCVEVCPNSAIEMRGYADAMPMGAALKPLRGTHSIIWTALFGETKYHGVDRLPTPGTARSGDQS